jgi:hypothetical protein
MSVYRSFTIEHINTHSGHVKGKENLSGRYVSRTPLGAVKKAATKVCRSSKIKGQCTLDITIKETTSGSKGKSYSYTVKRVKDPKTVVRDGVEITYKYNTIVKAKK